MGDTTLKFYGEPASVLNQVFNRLIVPNDVPTAEDIMTVFIDTGSTIPVWSNDTELLKSYFHNAHPTGLECMLAGFGGDGYFVPTWEIPEFTLTSSDKTVLFHNLHVAIDERFKKKFDIIMGLSMLRECKIEIELGKIDDVPLISLSYKHSEMWMNSKYIDVVEKLPNGEKKIHTCLESEEIYIQDAIIREERSIFSLTNCAGLCNDIKDLNYFPNAAFFVELLNGYVTTLTNEEIIAKVKERKGMTV